MSYFWFSALGKTLDSGSVPASIPLLHKPLKPSATVGIEHSRSHNNEMLGGFLSQLPNYEAYILQPFEVSF